ncbi:MAG TPA: hypothetical protein EYP98_20745 [Planctomycetes bacterium]|nr:hypothetical protein [Planctomycetota bacterium]
MLGLDVIEPIALETHLAGRPLVTECQRDRHDVALILNDHALLEGTIAGTLQHLPVRLADRDLQLFQFAD